MTDQQRDCHSLLTGIYDLNYWLASPQRREVKSKQANEKRRYMSSCCRFFPLPSRCLAPARPRSRQELERAFWNWPALARFIASSASSLSASISASSFVESPARRSFAHCRRLRGRASVRSAGNRLRARTKRILLLVCVPSRTSAASGERDENFVFLHKLAKSPTSMNLNSSSSAVRALAS